jgi:lipoprotein-anchoring transpeptidase ErfK/SrfK
MSKFMRDRLWTLAIVCVMASAIPASGAKQTSLPEGFQIYGGLSVEQPEPEFLFDQPLDAPLHRTVSLSTGYEPGTVIVRTGQRKLYYVLSDGKAVEYHVGVGRDGFTWSGTNRVSHKAEWPDWRPPREMIEREAALGNELPKFVAGGPDNPLGARAIYIGDTEFRIHGTTEPWTIGQQVSSGCIRMMNEEVIDLYDRVALGALVVVE